MMEQELQRMVREMEDKYRAQAFEALDEESKKAIVAKGQLELKEEEASIRFLSFLQGLF